MEVANTPSSAILTARPTGPRQATPEGFAKSSISPRKPHSHSLSHPPEAPEGAESSNARRDRLQASTSPWLAPETTT
eukprot:scaffold302014_cov30-Tisochrysis_lutea.AAC.2